MADNLRRHGFSALGEGAPRGALIAVAAPPSGQAILRGRIDDAEFAMAAAAALGAPLPDATNRVGRTGPLAVFRLGPDYWLAVHETDADFGRRLEEIEGLRALDASSSRARVRIKGAAVRDLLAVGAEIDLRAGAFPASAFAQTTVGNATAILHATAEGEFMVYVARSFADSWRLWLEEAGLEFGLDIAED